MKHITQAIALNKLVAHPDNPNSMSDTTFRKLVRNIERTGLYEPIVVRVHPEKQNCYQIINGHHRVKALEQLGRYEADCVVWDVDDGETAILLTTLNRLAGSDIPAKKIELLKKLTERMATAQLAKLLPQTAKQIERLANLKLNSVPIKLNADSFAVPLVFFVTKRQQGVIERAIEKMDNIFTAEHAETAEIKENNCDIWERGGINSKNGSGEGCRGPSNRDEPCNDKVKQVRGNDKQTNAQRRAAGITEMAEQFLREVEKCHK